MDKMRPARLLEKPAEKPLVHTKGRKIEELEDVMQLMKELKLSQMDAQQRMDDQISFMRDIFTKTSPLPVAPTPYYSPNQYGNREYPPALGNHTNVRGCY